MIPTCKNSSNTGLIGLLNLTEKPGNVSAQPVR